MYSQNYYRSSTSPYRAPSKSANSYNYDRYKTGNHEFGNETWPLDEVIDKIDLKSESDYDIGTNPSPSKPYSTSRTIPISHQSNPISSSNYSFGEPYRNRSNSPQKSRFGRVNSPDPDMVYSAFPDRTQSWTTSFNSGNYNKHNNSYESYKHKDSGNDYKYYDSNNNYVSDDQWSLDDGFKGPMVRDVAIQCNLKKYQQSLHSAVNEPSVERVITQKPPIKVIKSSPSGVVSTFSSVPKLSSTGGNLSRSSPYSELDFDSYEPSPQNDVLYTQVDKKHSHGRVPSSSKLNSSINSNLNVVFKAPVNDSIVSHSSSRILPNDGKQYDIRSKEYGFSVNNPAMNRVNLNSYDNRHMFNSSRDINDIPPTEKEILEETISISNASEDSYRLPKQSRNYGRDRDDLSYTGLSVASINSSNYRNGSPSRYDRFTSKTQSSPFGTMEKTRDAKTKIKKKKTSRKIDPENVLLSNNSLRLKSSKTMPSDRLYKSNADLRDSYVADETRGGLAAAYKQRQQMARTPTSDRQRALSLSRMSSAYDDHDENRSPSLQPSRHLSHLQLGGRGSRLSDSSTGTFQRTSSRNQLHERDPIVMYIPTASPRESPVKHGILRNNSTKSSATATLPTKGKKASESRKNKDSERLKSSSRANMRDTEKEETKKAKSSKEKKSSKKDSSSAKATSSSAIDLSRSQSMPKDTKFNWLSKLKLKSK